MLKILSGLILIYTNITEKFNKSKLENTVFINFWMNYNV